MLEAHVGYTLFNRKSKGVEPTEYAKLLNNLIIDALDRLENVENGFRAKAFNANRLVSIGISKHLMNCFGVSLVSKFDFIDFTFGTNEVLFDLVNSKKIDFAIVTKQYDTFDTLQQRVGAIKQVVVATLDIQIREFTAKIQAEDWTAVENWLNDQRWYSHDSGIPHIKLFWLHVFNKKRPAIVANYIIPSENEMLSILAQNTGVTIVWDCNAKTKIQNKEIQLVWDSPKMPETPVFLLSGKNDSLNGIAQEMVSVLKEVLA
jgi:DNA-binding transcriptional LysR family regulator